MEVALARNWWSLVIRGLVTVLLGIVTFAWPGITVGALVIVFGAYALVDGVVSIVGAWKAARTHERWGALILEGIAGIIVAVVTAIFPGLTALALVYLIAAWALVTGALEIAAAIRLRHYISHEWLLALSGVASVIFGILAILLPIAGAVALALGIGIYAFVFGVILIALGLRLRSWIRGPHPGQAFPLPAG